MEISKNKVNQYSRLAFRKQREKLGFFMAEGAKCVEDTIKYFKVEAILVEDSKDVDIKPYDGMPVMTVNEADMRKISQMQTLPEVIAIYKMPHREIIDKEECRSSITLLLDAIQDPGNLGTIIRIASWFGIRQVVMGVGCADPYNPKAVQSSMGAIGMVRLIQGDLKEIIDANQDIPVYGTLLDGEDIYRAELELPAFVVMGNEGNGLSKEIKDRVSKPLLIPSFADGPHAESLNVAAATAITVSEFMRKVKRKI